MININHLCMQCMKEHDGNEICPHCGYHEDGLQSAPYLPVKTWLSDRYVVGKQMTCDGEGVTYIGWDNILQSPVMIREFLPEDLCVRAADGVYVQFVADRTMDFNRTLITFLTMHRTLSRMSDLPALFPTYDVFEANGTGYAVSRYVESITLNEFLHRNGNKLTFEQTKALMLPTVSTLSSLHAADIVHGGISPDTLYVGKDGKLRFSGFAGSELRFSRGALKTRLFTGYAAMEQYGFDSNVGPHTDVYGFAATVYRTLTGQAPMDAKSRMNNPFDLSAALTEVAPSYAVKGLTHAMQLMPLDRTATAERFRTEFTAIPRVKEETFTVQEPLVPNPAPEADEPPAKDKSKGVLYSLIAMLATLLVLTVLFVFIEARWSLLGIFGQPETSSEPTSSQAASLDDSQEDDTQSQLTQEVEQFVGKTLEQCKTSGYDLTVYEVYSDDYPKNIVFAQDPPVGTQVSLEEDQITKYVIFVSMGSSKIKVPDVTNMPCAQALEELWEAGFTRDQVNFNTENYTYDSIVTQISPAAGTEVSVTGDDVMLYIQAPDSSSQGTATQSQATDTTE